MLPALLIAATFGVADASSHREAPGIALDPTADITDFYAFINPNDDTKAVFIMNVIPMELPGAGPNFYRFDDNVFYEIKIDNEGDGVEDISFAFKFRTDIAYPDTFLYNLGDIADPANINLRQTMLAARFDDGMMTTPFVDANNRPVLPPANVGVASDPTNGYLPSGPGVGQITTDYTLTAGPNDEYRIFVGPRQESFFVDLERTFDLLNVGHPDNSNTLLGYNVHTIAIEVPIDLLTRDGQMPSAALGNDVIAAWATTSRRRFVTRDASGDGETGGWVQVGRLGNPLVNEVVIPMSMKDTFNRSQPADDGQFLSYVCEPEMVGLMNGILGTSAPLTEDAGLGFQPCREDLVLAFLTGLPGATMPQNYMLGGPIPGEPGKFFGAFEALRLNLTVPMSGFPNGRTPQDDVVDTALSAVAGLLIDGVTVVPDGVDSTGINFPGVFPFLGDPWIGNAHPNGTHASTPLPGASAP